MKLSLSKGFIVMNDHTDLKSILLLVANPKGTQSLRVQEEERDIKARLRLEGYGKVPIHSSGATRTRDIYQAMLDFRPQIVHFSGHGAGQDGLVFEDVTGQEKLVSSEALADLFKLFSNRGVECVVLNACYSKFQAEAIAQHIDYVIGMSQSIGDRAAIEFSVGFYSALGAGESIEFAYQLGCNAIELEGIPEHLIPVLFRKGEVICFDQRNTEKLQNELDQTLKNSDNFTGNRRFRDLTNGQEKAIDLEEPETIELQMLDLKRGDIIPTERGRYRILSILAQGDLTTVYEGVQIHSDEKLKRVAVKIADCPADNDLLQNEVKILKLFREESHVQAKHLPILVDCFKTSSGQWGTVLELIEGFDFDSIREKYSNGVPQVHVVWILQRALSVLGFAHSKGIIHANIDPTHLIVQPLNHNVYLIDWSYALICPAKTAQTFKCFNAEYSAPEVAERNLPLPSSDLYSLGKTAIYLLRGDLVTNALPDSVDRRLSRFIQFFLRDSCYQRAQDAWEMYQELKYLRKEIFGEHQFLEFTV
jgi:Protein kinase domain/CHAT domain